MQTSRMISLFLEEYTVCVWKTQCLKTFPWIWTVQVQLLQSSCAVGSFIAQVGCVYKSHCFRPPLHIIAVSLHAKPSSWLAHMGAIDDQHEAFVFLSKHPLLVSIGELSGVLLLSPWAHQLVQAYFPIPCSWLLVRMDFLAQHFHLRPDFNTVLFHRFCVVCLCSSLIQCNSTITSLPLTVCWEDKAEKLGAMPIRSCQYGERRLGCTHVRAHTHAHTHTHVIRIPQ